MQYASTCDLFLFRTTTTTLAVVFDIAAQLRSATASRAGHRHASDPDDGLRPCIVPSAIVADRGSAAIGWRWWALSGLCSSIVTAIAWRIWSVVERSTRRRVLTFVALAGV